MYNGYLTTSGCGDSNIVCGLSACGTGIYKVDNNSNNNNKMKETNLKNFTIVFEKTEVKKFTYKLMAENEEDAKKKIEDGWMRNDEETVSIVIKEVK